MRRHEAGGMHDTAIVWFRRDLRLRDNEALADALARARVVVPLFVYAPEEEGNCAHGAASRWWLHHSLAAFDQQLRKLGSRLIIRRGPTLDSLRDLARETNATLITWNRLCEPLLAARDRALEGSLQEHDVEIATQAGNVLFEPGSIRNGQKQPYRVFTAFWRAASVELEQLPPPRPAPRRIRSPATWPKQVPLDELSLLPKINWDGGLATAWTPGEAGAVAQLRSFLKRIHAYEDNRNRPDVVGTSRLSPHLHFGELTVRHVMDSIRQSGELSSGARGYARQLGWREFAHHLLHDFPDTPSQPLDQKFIGMRWSRTQSTLTAWHRGLTGYPIVDAGMRELWHTGWMHNRVRMIVASFLTKNLQHAWTQGARWFWDTLVDADLANNTLGWQWVAGCGADAAPYYRIFNPILQAERFDPERAYLRQWLPELRQLPDRWIHRPWQCPPEVLRVADIELGKTYPRPVVELQRSREAAMQAYRRIQGRKI